MPTQLVEVDLLDLLLSGSPARFINTKQYTSVAEILKGARSKTSTRKKIQNKRNNTWKEENYGGNSRSGETSIILMSARHILEGERIQSPPLGLSLPLSPPFSHPPLLSRCGCAVERRTEGELRTNTSRSCCCQPLHSWAFITDCPAITFPLLWLESPSIPYISIYHLGSLLTLSSVPDFQASR